MKKSVLIGLIIGLVGLAAAGWLWWKPTANTAVKAVVLPTPSTGLVTPLDSSLFEAVGQVGAGAEQPVPARTTGRVRSIFFAGGDYVRRGQPLVKLSNHTFVLAPHNGFLGPCQVKAGQYIALTTPITTISALNYLVVPVVLPPRGRGRVQPGDSVRVWVAARPGRVVSGVVGPKPADTAEGAVNIVLATRAPFRIGEQAHVRLRDHDLAKATVSTVSGR